MSHLQRATRRAATSIAIGGLLAAPAIASGAGTQSVDVTTALTCTEPLANESVSLRVVGTLPAQTKQGEFLDTSDLTMTMRFPRGNAFAVGPAPHQFSPSLSSLRVEAAENGPLSLMTGFGGDVTTIGPERWEVTQDLHELAPTFVGGAAPVKLTLVGANPSFVLASPDSGNQVAANSADCTVVGGPIILATVANGGSVAPGAPALFVSSAPENQGISSARGGLLHLRGTNLKGVRTIKFGPHTVRVALNTGSTIYAVVPALAEEGTWPATVARADGTASAENPDVTVTIYGG